MGYPFEAAVLARQSFEDPAAIIMAAIKEFSTEYDADIRLLSAASEGKSGFIVEVDGVAISVVFGNATLTLPPLTDPERKLRDSTGLLIENRAHALLATCDAYSGRQASLKASMALLQVASVLVGPCRASAVYWHAAQTLTASSLFRTAIAAASTSEASIPIQILGKVVAYLESEESAAPKFGIFATGLMRFIGREVEFIPKPLPIADMYNGLGLIVGSLLNGFIVPEDGHTYGRTESERIRIRYRDNGILLTASPVFLCDIEQVDPSVVERRN